MLLCFIGLFLQLNNIQVLKANSLATSASNPRVIEASLDQPRGEIISADNVTLAQSVVATSGSRKYQRVYPPDTATLFSQIVGYDSPIYGEDGVEAEYDNYLSAHSSPPKTLQELLTNRTTYDNVTLTISTGMQLAMNAALDHIKGNPDVSAAVAIDPRNGDILGMYSNPSFDPNPLVSTSGTVETSAWTTYNNTTPNPLLNRAYRASYEPGSTFKTITSAAAYDFQPALTTHVYPVVGCISLEPQSNVPLCNYGRNTPEGPEQCGGDLQQTLPESCDTAFAQMGMSLGAQALTTEAQAFGFNQRIPIDLPYVPLSNFPTVAQLANNEPSQAYSAFGQQNVSATALQMALVAAGFANDGVIETPHVMAQIVDDQGNLVKAYTPTPWLKATSPATAASVTKLMQAVVTSGTAKDTFPAGDDVAAKTGTAETGAIVNGASSETNDWMIAFAPATDPTVAVAVVVPNQPADATGDTVSGPPTCAIIQAALDKPLSECPGQ
jgi:peptidoglycan glycosyltransferase